MAGQHSLQSRYKFSRTRLKPRCKLRQGALNEELFYFGHVAVLKHSINYASTQMSVVIDMTRYDVYCPRINCPRHEHIRRLVGISVARNIPLDQLFEEVMELGIVALEEKYQAPRLTASIQAIPVPTWTKDLKAKKTADASVSYGEASASVNDGLGNTC
jgi:hypothetical protein